MKTPPFLPAQDTCPSPKALGRQGQVSVDLCAPTPLDRLPDLAGALGIKAVVCKREDLRPFGNFKILGGYFAAHWALAQALDCLVPQIPAVLAARLSGHGGGADQPLLICASDGNHGLSVALAGRDLKVMVWVYLPKSVPLARAARIAATGARLIWVAGTYDDAVDAAWRAAKGVSQVVNCTVSEGGEVLDQGPDKVSGPRLLIADTSRDPRDPIVEQVQKGYGRLMAEVRDQVKAMNILPTHAFVQAGVGGLAAAVAAGFRSSFEKNHKDQKINIIVVEPRSCPAVAVALEAGQVVRVAGGLETAADMLSCGEASAPALDVLLAYGVQTIQVDEDALLWAKDTLTQHLGHGISASGAAGLAGLGAAIKSMTDGQNPFGLSKDSQVLVIASEGEALDLADHRR